MCVGELERSESLLLWASGEAGGEDLGQGWSGDFNEGVGKCFGETKGDEELSSYLDFDGLDGLRWSGSSLMFSFRVPGSLSEQTRGSAASVPLRDQLRFSSLFTSMASSSSISPFCATSVLEGSELDVGGGERREGVSVFGERGKGFLLAGVAVEEGSGSVGLLDGEEGDSAVEEKRSMIESPHTQQYKHTYQGHPSTQTTVTHHFLSPQLVLKTFFSWGAGLVPVLPVPPSHSCCHYSKCCLCFHSHWHFHPGWRLRRRGAEGSQRRTEGSSCSLSSPFP